MNPTAPGPGYNTGYRGAHLLGTPRTARRSPVERVARVRERTRLRRRLHSADGCRRNRRRRRGPDGPARRPAVSPPRPVLARHAGRGRAEAPAACGHREAAFHLAERALRPLRPRRAARGARSTRAGAAPRSRRASCVSSCPASTSGAAARSAFDVDRDPDADPLHRRHLRQARARDRPRRAIPALVEQHGIDFVIANVENSAAGFGITGDIADTLLGYGVDVMTSGNHIWDKKEVLDYIPRQPRLLRPANFPAGVPGRGSYHRTHPHRRAGRRDQRDGPRVHAAARRPVRGRRCARSRRSARRRGSSSSTSTPKRPPRKSRWAGISTAGSPPSSARTRTCRPPTSASCRRARPT